MLNLRSLPRRLGCLLLMKPELGKKKMCKLLGHTIEIVIWKYGIKPIRKVKMQISLLYYVEAVCFI